MQMSKETGAIFEALAKAQAVLQDPPARGVNPHYKSKFARLQDALPLVRSALSACGISILQGVNLEQRVLVTLLAHSSGQWVQSEYPIAIDGNPQKQGSALTYARRYSLFALVGIAPGDDDDGNTASVAALHPSWPADADAFIAALDKMELTLDGVARLAIVKGWGDPRSWDSQSRNNLVRDLGDDPNLWTDANSHG